MTLAARLRYVGILPGGQLLADASNFAYVARRVNGFSMSERRKFYIWARGIVASFSAALLFIITADLVVSQESTRQEPLGQSPANPLSESTPRTAIIEQ